MALEGGDSFVRMFPLLLGSRPFSLWREVPLRQTRKQSEELELEGGLYNSDEIKVLREGRVAFTKGPSDTVWTPKNCLWS